MNIRKLFARAALALAFTVLTATTAWAQDAITGLTYNSTGGYYEINDAQDLVDFSTYVNAGNNASGKTFKQTQDIDMSSISNFTPIGVGSKTKYFGGTYDGGGYTISGLYISHSLTRFAGLFSYVEEGTVRNVILVSPSVTNTNTKSNNGYKVGALIGYTFRCTVENCHVVSPTLNATGSGDKYYGALVGESGIEYDNFTNCCYYTDNASLAGIGKFPRGDVSRAYTITPADGVTIQTPMAADLGFTCDADNDGTAENYWRTGAQLTLNYTGTVPEGYTFGGYTVNGTAIDGNTFTIGSEDAAIAATFTPDPAHFSQSGDEYTIHTATGWNLFCDCLNDNTTWNRFSGKIVKLGDDIEVTRMAGGSGHEFTGTFDGGGKTLTVNYANTGNGTMTAPFSYVDGATIQNLIVGGTISGTAYRAAGIIGETVNATSHITNCVSSVNISSGRYTGGFSIGGNVEIDGCVFNGKINGTDRSGGFIGFSNSAQVIKNSLFAPQDGSSINGGTFYFNGGGDVAPVNSYYTQALGTAQGKALRTVSAGDNVTIEAVALTGTATQYTVSGITAYSGGGLKRGETLYYGSDDQLSLTLSNTATGAPQGYGYDGYTASAGTLDGTTLTMPDADVTISVDTDVLRSTGQPVSVSYIDANGQPAFHDAIALDGTENNLGQYEEETWYFVGTSFSHSGMIRCYGDVNIILADGKTMTTTSDGDGIWGNGTLTIYGQTLGTGTLHASGGNIGISHYGNVIVNGGTVNATGAWGIGANGNVTINGGTVTATATDDYGIEAGGNITINGGTVTATANYGIEADGNITLGWTRPDDRITASSISAPFGTVAVADGQALTDGNGHIYTGTLTDDEISAIAGKTLSPLQAISYIAADGKTRQCTDFTVLTGNETELDNTDGWYVAIGTLNYDHTLILSADVNLILADGCQMNFGTSESRLDCYGINYTGYPTLNIYGQSTGNDMGTLSAYTTGNETHAIRAYGLSINGGNVVANAIGDDANGLDVYDDLIVNDGNVIATATGYSATAISTEYDLHVNGGNVTATVNGESAFAICVAMNKFEVNGGKVMVTVTGDNATAICHHTEYRSLFAGGTITVTGANDNGNIYLNGATVTFSSYGGYMEVGEGLFYTDGEGNYYYGELTSSEMSAIAGKTLSPSSSPAISLADTDAELNQKLLALDGVTLDVTLANRTIDTEWNTLTVPFNVTYWQLTETFGEGVKLYELTGSSLVGDVLGLEFTSATSIEVGKPYFIKASANVVNPTFHDVTIDAWANSTSATDYVDFIPTLGVSEIQGDRITDVLVLGGNNTLYNPASLPAKMKAFRGYFRVHDYSPAAEAMQFRMTFDDATEDDVTGIVQIENSKLKGDHSDALYNLMGVRVKSADKGLFIVKGKKIIVK